MASNEYQACYTEIIVEKARSLDAQNFLASVRYDIRSGKSVNASLIKQTAQDNPEVYGVMLDQLETHLRQNEIGEAAQDIQVTYLLGMNELPQTGPFLNNVRSEYGISYEPPTPRRQRRLGISSRVALVTAAGLTGAASLAGTAGPHVLSMFQNQGEKDRIELLSVSTTTSTPVPTETKVLTPTKTPIPTPTTEPTPEVKTFPRDIFREQIAPKIYAQAQQRRNKRYANDPDFKESVNFSLIADSFTVLVAGSAVRAKDPQTGIEEDDPLTDSIQLLIYNIPSNTVHVISIPRDLASPEVIEKSGTDKNSRINVALTVGGPQLLRKAVEHATSLPVDFFVHMNSDLLIDAINQTVKTIDVVLDRPIYDEHYPTINYGEEIIYFPQGKNTLNGEDALKAARARHSSDDYFRAEVQQQVFEAFIKKLLSEDFLTLIRHLKILDDLWYQKVNQKINQGANRALEPDFDLNQLFFSDLSATIAKTPLIAWDRLVGGVKILEWPTIYSTGISERNFVNRAGVPEDVYLTKIGGGNLWSPDPINDYWKKTRVYTKQFITENSGDPPDQEEVQVKIPLKQQKILYPQRLKDKDLEKWILKLEGAFESVSTHPLSIDDIATLFPDQTGRILKEIAKGYAEALIEHFGPTETIIGLDPAHGGSDNGSTSYYTLEPGEVLKEKDLTMTLAKMIADEVYQQTGGLYTLIILRPEDLKTGMMSTVERKALLLETASKLIPPGKPLPKAYISINLANPYADPTKKGAQVTYPNEKEEADTIKRAGSKNLAQIFLTKLGEKFRLLGYPKQ